MKFRKILTVLLSISMLAAFSACDEKEESSKNDEIVTETVAVDEEKKAEAELQEKAAEEAEKAEKAAEEAEQAEENDMMNSIFDEYDAQNPEETVVALLESGFESTFPNSMNVEYDEASTTYIISVWQEGFAKAVETEEGKSALNELKDTLSSSVESMLTSVRLIDEDANIKFEFLSDEDKDTVLLEITNDEVTYSIAE